MVTRYKCESDGNCPLCNNELAKVLRSSVAFATRHKGNCDVTPAPSATVLRSSVVPRTSTPVLLADEEVPPPPSIKDELALLHAQREAARTHVPGTPFAMRPPSPITDTRNLRTAATVADEIPPPMSMREADAKYSQTAKMAGGK